MYQCIPFPFLFSACLRAGFSNNKIHNLVIYFVTGAAFGNQRKAISYQLSEAGGT